MNALAEAKAAGDRQRRHLPDSFWNTTPELATIAQSADAGMVGREAVLCVTLARVVAATDKRLVLPRIVASWGSLNCTACLVGDSSAGKTGALAVADDLLPLPESVRTRPLGSGEGMLAQAFHTYRKDPDGGNAKVLERDCDNVLFHHDEGQELVKMLERSGQTTGEFLRSSWSGAQLGASTKASSGVTLAAHDYRIAVVLGIQPENARGILAEEVGGTPQRFLWVPTLNPGLPDIDDLPDFPDPIKWEMPALFEADAVTVKGRTAYAMPVDRSVSREIRTARQKAATGAITVAPLDAHRNLVRLKVAASLALLHGSVKVTRDWWLLAEQIVLVSDRTRQTMQDAIARHRLEAELESTDKAIRRTLALTEANETARVDRIANGMARFAERQGKAVPRSAVKKSTASGADRQSADDALDRALAKGWLVAVDATHVTFGTRS